MTTTIGHDSRAVANKILLVAQERGVKLTIMQLLKLIYFAHGWLLASCDRPLTRDKPQAWQYGPVYPLVYRSAPRTGVEISGLLSDDFTDSPVLEEFSAEEIATIGEVVDGYGRMHAFNLSRLTHQDGSPWHRAYHQRGAYSEIPDEWIADYFKGLKAA